MYPKNKENEEGRREKYEMTDGSTEKWGMKYEMTPFFAGFSRQTKINKMTWMKFIFG